MRIERIRESIIDLHVHIPHDEPSWRAKYVKDLTMKLRRTCPGGAVLKSPSFPTVLLAQLLSEICDMKVHGSLVLNESIGGINVKAVEKALKEGAKVIWMPTLDAWNHRRYQGQSGGLTIFNPRGEVLLEVEEILSLIADHHAVLGTGHLSPGEVNVLLDEARSLGVNRIFISHVTWGPTFMTIKQQKKLVGRDVFFEYPLELFIKEKELREQVVSAIREVGVEYCIITSSAEFTCTPLDEVWDKGLMMLLEAGFTVEEIYTMAVENPKRLIEG